jgi:hypothetical protein
MGGKSAPPPDYAPLAQASRESAQIMGALGKEQLAFSRQQYAELAPLIQGIARTQQQAQEEQMGQARDYYDYMRSTYRPVERGLAAEAQRFDTDAYRNELASKAAADVGRAFTATQGAQQRAMAGMGVNPNSGRFASTQSQANLGLAAQRAAAMTGTRQQAQQMGYARKLDVAGLGRGLPGASTAAYGGATNAGNAAANSYMMPGNQFNQGFGSGASMIGQGLGQQIQGQSQILNTQGQLYGQSMNNQNEIFGSLLGAGARAGTAYLMAGSDIRIKENIERVGTHFRTQLPIYEFNYTHIPDKRFRGVMAQDVEKVFPDAVETMHDGIKVVNYAMLGMEMEEV